MGLWSFINELRNAQREATPTLAKTIQQANEATALDLRVCMPAEIITYDKDKMLANVQPLLKRKYNDGTVVNTPPIYNVPVGHPRAGNAYIHLPLKKGHKVLLVFSDRSLEKWLSSGGNVDPEDYRHHDLSDAIAYPGVYPFNDVVPVDNNNDIIIRNGNDGGGRSEMRVKPNNHFQFVNSTNELIKVLCDIMRHIREGLVSTDHGPEPLQHPSFESDEARLRSFLETK